MKMFYQCKHRARSHDLSHTSFEKPFSDIITLTQLKARSKEQKLKDLESYDFASAEDVIAECSYMKQLKLHFMK